MARERGQLVIDNGVRRTILESSRGHCSSEIFDLSVNARAIVS